LNDGKTGYPVACLEASIISAARTAASAVLGATKLNGGRKSVHALGVVGTGLIARYIVEFLLQTGWAVDNLHVYDLSSDYAGRFVQRFENKINSRVYLHNSADKVVEKSDITVFATTAATPYVSDINCLQHNPIILHISLRDLAPELILQSHNVVDDVDHCLKANTSLHLTEQKLGNRDFVPLTFTQRP
jgi:ornithine cyclodeaminase